MINYVVKPGDMIGVLAVKYKTTIRVLMDDNPIIPVNQQLQSGWKLKIYTPEENAKRHSETAYAQIEKAHALRNEIQNTDYLLAMPSEPVYYKEREVLDGQIAFAKIVKPTPLLEMQSNGYTKVIRTLSKGEILRVYEVTTFNDGMYLVDGYQWITTDPSIVLYDEIPQYNLDGKIHIAPLELKSNKPRSMSTFSTLSAAAIKPTPTVGSGTPQKVKKGTIKPTSMIGSGATPKYSKKNDGISSIGIFERPSYKRPVLQMKNAKGDTSTVELRVLGFSASYSNSIAPAPTNSGWMINIRANSLPTLQISGFLMETKAQNEFNSFMDRYKKYLQASRSGDYYSMGISTLYYKKTEYKGIITSFNFSDREEESLHRKYTLGMIVLKEKTLSSSELKKVPTVVSRGGVSEATFRSSLAGMLANPVTGKKDID